MSKNAWEAFVKTSLHPLTHFRCHAIILTLDPYNDVGDVVSHALLLVRPEYLRYDILMGKNNFEHLLRRTLQD